MKSKILLLLFALLPISKLLASPALFEILQDEKSEQIKQSKSDSFKEVVVFTLDPNRLFEWNQSIGESYDNVHHQFKLTLPVSTGEDISFVIANSQTLGAPFRENFANVYNFKGQSEDGKFRIRITTSDHTIYAKITEVKTRKEWILHPESLNSQHYIMFDKADDLRKNDNVCSLIDNDVEQEVPNDNGNLSTFTEVGIGALRTYKIMVALNDGFTSMLGGVPNSVVALANTIDRVSEIYERDLNVRFLLVTNNDIIYTTTSTTNPFLGFSNHMQFLATNLLLFDTIPATDYDLGHVFSQIGGGVAYRPSLCNADLKAGASSGIQNYPNEYFITTVAHEIGHQFGAAHTHSSSTGSCGSNYSQNDSWEIAGGSSIMSYTFSCAPLVYTYSSYHYFNAGSIRRMQSTMASYWCNGVGQNSTSSTNLNAPVIHNIITNYTIPANTPFKLQLDATDADGDVLTYVFDQHDSIATGMSVYPTGYEVNGPLYKHLMPQLSNQRYFPSLGNLVNGNVNSFEILPQVARTINFIGFVRDNHDESGRTAEHNFLVTVNDACGAFEITNFTTATNLIANGTNQTTLNWNTASCVYNGNINIRFSTDGGYTYPYVLVANTANDGTETITVPNLQTTNGRFMIETTGHILFNVNEAPISIANTSVCLAKGVDFDDLSPLTREAGHADLDLDLEPAYGVLTTTISGDYTSGATASNLVFFDNQPLGCSGPSNSNLAKVIFEGYVDVTDSFLFNFDFIHNQVLNIYEYSYNSNAVCGNFINSTGVYNGTAVSLTGSVKVLLQKGIKYVIVANTFSNTVPNTSTYTITYTSPLNGKLYHGGALNPGASYNYGYVIVNNVTEKIVKVTDNPDLSIRSDFNTGIYRVHGLSTNSTLSSLNTLYQNVDYQDLFEDVVYQTNGLCAELSPNYKMVTIITPLSIRLLSFDGNLETNTSGKLTWKAEESDDLVAYSLEKSIDASNFEQISLISKKSNNGSNNKQTYAFIDHQINTTSYYRLKMIYLDGKEEFSNVVRLAPKQEKAQVQLFPNPIRNNQILQITLPSDTHKKVDIRLVNAVGKLVAFHTVDVTPQTNVIQFPIADLTPGVYMINITDDAQSNNYKLVVTH